jgi:aspartyl-tRNA(Asn)/glutamyl-tRNA(Gln) amidotransferase subunit A
MSMSSTQEITSLSAEELVSLLRTRALSSVEVTSAFLERIDSINPKLNAFCTVAHDLALDQARQADREVSSGASLGPLHGLPIAFKDLTPTKGVRTTRGSRLFEHAVPSEDAILVKRLRKAGAVLVGKTNTPEFGHKGETSNLIFGATRNPWNLDRTPGGSSGGSASAVAAGLVPFAEGSDGAGSIRIPASMCGIVGFKPTYGQVPDVAGPFSSHTPFFHNGPLAKTVGDAALLYQAMAGAEWLHPFSIPTRDDASITLEFGVSGLRIGYSNDLGYFSVSDEVISACTKAAHIFEDLGSDIEEFSIDLGQQIEDSFLVLWCGKLATVYSDLGPDEFQKLEPAVQNLIERGTKISAVQFGKANLTREIIWQKLCSLFERYDLLLCPTTATTAFPIDVGPPTHIKGRPVNKLLGWFLTYPFNMTGNPAASIPCGRDADGLPIGMQLIGRRFDDALVLRACRAFEKAQPWCRPSLIDWSIKHRSKS